MSRDSRLIQKLKEGDEKAFDEVYYSYYKLVYYQAYQILDNKDDAEDVMQNAFIRFMREIDRIVPDSNLKSLLSTIAKNLALDEYRRKANLGKNRECIEDIEGTTSTADKYSESNLLITLRGALERDEARILVLKVCFDYTFKEIEHELNIPMNSVEAKYYKALKKIRAYYKEH